MIRWANGIRVGDSRCNCICYPGSSSLTYCRPLFFMFLFFNIWFSKIKYKERQRERAEKYQRPKLALCLSLYVYVSLLIRISMPFFETSACFRVTPTENKMPSFSDSIDTSVSIGSLGPASEAKIPNDRSLMFKESQPLNRKVSKTKDGWPKYPSGPR